MSDRVDAPPEYDLTGGPCGVALTHIFERDGLFEVHIFCPACPKNLVNGMEQVVENVCLRAGITFDNGNEVIEVYVHCC